MLIYTCKLCNKKFKQKTDFDRHMARKTPCNPSKTCMCSMCGKKFSNKQNLNRHIKNVHNKKVDQISTLQEHIARLEEENKHIILKNDNKKLSIEKEYLDLKLKYNKLESKLKSKSNNNDEIQQKYIDLKRRTKKMKYSLETKNLELQRENTNLRNHIAKIRKEYEDKIEKLLLQNINDMTDEL